MTEHDTALNKAKIALMSQPDSAFFTTLCFSLQHVWDDSIKTACTNGTEIRYNPTFFMGLPAPVRVSLLVHETLHVALLHMDRLATRSMSKFNRAADYVINYMIKERGFPLGDGWLYDPQYADMSTEQVYKLLPDNCEPPGMMDLEASNLPSDQLVEQVQGMVVRAAVQSKMDGDRYGTIPGDIQVFLNKLISPCLPWNRILQKYMNSLCKSDFSYQRPNRRYFPDYYLPTLKGEKLKTIAVAADISGSVSKKDFTAIISEVHSILKMTKPDKMSLVQFDTRISKVDVVKTLLDLKDVTFTGGGCTDIAPVFQWVEEEQPQLILIFTDGFFGMNVVAPKNNVIWLIHGNPKFTAPFGKVIHYTPKEK